MKSTLISSLVFLAFLPLIAAAERPTSFVGKFVVDESTWEREARTAVQQNKVQLTWSVDEMVGWIKYLSAGYPSIEIKPNGAYVLRSPFFGVAHGQWQLKDGTLIASPDKVQTEVTEPGFSAVPFSISLRGSVSIRWSCR